MNEATVVNVAKGGWYPKGQDRLRGCLLHHHGPQRAASVDGVDFATWNGCVPKQSPEHNVRPYAFKAYAIDSARCQHPESHVFIWLDASMVLINPLDKILDYTAEHGACVWDSGWALGSWCKDEALAIYGITRDDAMTVPMIVGGAFALDMRHARGRAIFDRLFEYAQHPTLFTGEWDNKKGNLGDSRCLGHRHDMPALTMACRAYDAPIIRDGTWFRYDAAPSNDDIIIALGKGEIQ